MKAFVMECVLLGMEYSVTFLTLWIYITTLVKTDQPKLFYSLISSAYLLSAVVLSIGIGRWVDRTRSIRVTFFVCNSCVILGNLMYAYHKSPWFLVAGRFLCGIGGPLRSVISGEVSRCFPSDQVMKKFSTMGTAFSLGFIMGPGVNFIFKDVDVFLGPFHLTVANISGFYMASFFAILQVIVIFTVSDLSKEYDLKADEMQFKRTIRTASQRVRNTSYIKPHVSAPVKIKNTEPLQQQLDENFAASMNENFEDDVNISQRSFEATDFPDHNSYMNSSTLLPFRDLSLTNSIFAQSTIQNLSIQRSVAIDKMEKPALFPQTFTRADCLLSVSVMIANGSLVEDQTNEYLIQTPSSVVEILKQIVSSVDAILVFFLSFSMYFWMVAFDMWLPMMVIDVLGMGMTELNGIVFGFGCISAVVLLLLSWNKFSDKTMYKLSLVCVAALAVMEVIFGSMKLFHQNLYLNILLWIVWGTLFAIVVVMDEVFIIGILAKMTNSNIQTFNESLRLSMTRAGALVALISSGMLFQYVEYLCFAGIIFCVITFFLLVWRRSFFQNPTLIIK